MNEYKSFRKKIKIQIRLKIDTKSEKTNDIKEAERLRYLAALLFALLRLEYLFTTSFI